jgi:putative sigma-54 modulation protein
MPYLLKGLIKMKCNIRGNKLEITDAIRNYIEEKIGRLDKYFKSEELTSNVLVKVRGNKQIIEVTIPTNKYILRSEVEDDDLYAAIDLASEKLERQIRKNKTKLQKRINDSLNKEFNFDYEIETSIEEEKEKTIVKRKSIETKPMDEEEAILEMELLGHDFFVYKDMHSESTCILYKRKDGNYGLIETE